MSLVTLAFLGRLSIQNIFLSAPTWGILSVMESETTRQVSPKEAYDAWTHDPVRTAILDVRTGIERAASWIPGSLHIPLDEFPARISEIAGFERVFVICRSGGRSSAACLAAERVGHTHLVNIAGGMKAWGSAGLPEERATSSEGVFPGALSALALFFLGGMGVFAMVILLRG